MPPPFCFGPVSSLLAVPSLPWLGDGHLLPASLTVKVVRANTREDFKVWPQVVLTHLKVRDL